MPDPFSFPDPFASIDPFSNLGGGGRRRQAAYPPLGEAETDSAIGNLTGGFLSGIGYVGSELDKFFGGRAVRGLLGGKPRELLSLIPGSDVVHLTDEADTVRGEDLLRNVGYDPSRGNWLERNLAGPVVEGVLDPATWLGGVGALTKAGQAAAKTGALTKGLIPGVKAGERSLHPMVALAGKVFGEKAAQDAAVGALEGTGAWAGRRLSEANVGVRKLPGVGGLAGAAIDTAGVGAKQARLAGRALFDPKVGGVVNEIAQGSHEAVKVPAMDAGIRASKGRAFDLDQRRQALVAAGANPKSVERLLRQMTEDVAPKAIDIGMGPHLPELQAIADETKQFGRVEPRQAEVARGLPSPELDDPYAGYMLRQWVGPSGEGRKAREKLLPTGGRSLIRRKEAVRAHPGGTIGIEDYGTPEMAGAARTLPDKAVAERILGDLLEPHGLGPQGIPLAPEVLRKERERAVALGRMLKGVRPEQVADPVTGLRESFFNPDVITSAETRSNRAASRTSSADAVYDVIGKAHGLARGADTDVSVRKALAAAGLEGEQAYRLAARAVGLDPDAILSAAVQVPHAPPDPVQVLGKALDPFALPGPEARAATKLLNRWQTPEEWKPVLGWLDWLNSKFRDLTYSVWPASWGRNLGSGVAENAFEGTGPLNAAYGDVRDLRAGKGIETGIPDIIDALTKRTVNPEVIIPVANSADVGALTTAAMKGGTGGRRLVYEHVDPAGNVTRGAVGPTHTVTPPTPDQQRIALMREMYVHGVGGFGQGQAGASKVGVRGGPAGFTEPREPVASMMKGFPKAPIETGKRVSEAVEENLRMPQYLDLRRKGYDARTAAAEVLKNHFDYTASTDFENAVMKRLIPFYTFPSRNFPKQVRRAVQSPGKASVPIRLAGPADRGEEDYVPEYLQGGLALPLGGGGGAQTYLSQLGLPMEEAFSRLKVGKNATDTVRQSGMGLLGMLRPELKGPLELLTGKQFFTGRDMADLHVGQVESGFGNLDEETSRLLAQALLNSPATRMVSTANRLLDERKHTPAGIAGLGLGLTTGAKITDVDTEKWRAIDARHNLESLMQGSPGIRESVDYYPSPEAKAAHSLTPRQEEELRLYASLKLRARKAAEEKKRVGVQVGIR